LQLYSIFSAARKTGFRFFTSSERIINNCSYILALIDGLEEQMILSTAKKKSRRILHENATKLEAERIYWKIEPKLDGPSW
jgi:hypothetical protein